MPAKSVVYGNSASAACGLRSQPLLCTRSRYARRGGCVSVYSEESTEPARARVCVQIVASSSLFQPQDMSRSKVVWELCCIAPRSDPPRIDTIRPLHDTLLWCLYNDRHHVHPDLVVSTFAHTSLYLLSRVSARLPI